jgi:hypothetical protein
MSGFLYSGPEYLGETANRGQEDGRIYPKNKSIFQNLKFHKLLPVHIYVRQVEFFERILCRS